MFSDPGLTFLFLAFVAALLWGLTSRWIAARRDVLTEREQTKRAQLKADLRRHEIDTQSLTEWSRPALPPAAELSRRSVERHQRQVKASQDEPPADAS